MGWTAYLALASYNLSKIIAPFRKLKEEKKSDNKRIKEREREIEQIGKEQKRGMLPVAIVKP